MSTQISRNSLNNTVSLVYFRNIHMDNQNFKKLSQITGDKFTQVHSTSITFQSKFVANVDWTDTVSKLFMNWQNI